MEEKKEVDKRLKELEADLAKELDQNVKLSKPSDPRLEGSVMLNPELDTTKKNSKSPAPQHAEAVEAETFENDNGEEAADVDKLLDDLDKGFSSKLKSLESDIGQIELPATLESVPLGKDVFDGDPNESKKSVEDPLSDGPSEKPLSPLTAIFRLSKALVIVPPSLIITIGKQLLLLKKNPPKEVLSQLIVLIQPKIKRLQARFHDLKQSLTQYSRKTVLGILMILLLFSGLGYVIRDIVSNFRIDKEKDPFLRSFSDVAKPIDVPTDEEEGEDLESPLRHPEYAVLTERITANLKAPDERHFPMAVMQLYVEASSQDAAIEIKDRKIEIKDLLQRIIEQSTFDELETLQGKARLKIKFRSGINHIINKGRARRIYFQTLNIHQ